MPTPDNTAARVSRAVNGRDQRDLSRTRIIAVDQERSAKGRVASRFLTEFCHRTTPLKNGSLYAAQDLDFQVPDFLAQCIAIQPQKLRRADLVSTGGRQREIDQGALHLPQHGII